MLLVRFAPEPPADAAHEFVTHDDAKQKLTPATPLLFGDGECRWNCRCARMTVTALVAVVEFIAMGAQSVGKCGMLGTGQPGLAINSGFQDRGKLARVFDSDAAPFRFRRKYRNRKVVEYQILRVLNNFVGKLLVTGCGDECGKSTGLVHLFPRPNALTRLVPRCPRCYCSHSGFSCAALTTLPHLSYSVRT